MSKHYYLCEVNQFIYMRSELLEFYIHEEILSVMKDGGVNALAISKTLALAQDYSGLIFIDDINEYSFLIERNYLLPVNRIIDYYGESLQIKNLFILNCDYLWKGESWMRGVYTYEGGVIRYLQPWIPAVDTIEKAKQFGFIM